MASLLKEPAVHAGAIVALATFFKANMAVNSVPCPTVRNFVQKGMSGIV